MGLLFVGYFPRDFQEGKRPIESFVKRPIDVEKRPIYFFKEGKRPIEANGLSSGTPDMVETAPLKRPMNKSMR